METIKNFVDNIHNEAYKDSYASPCLGTDSYVFPGGRTEQSLDGAWNFSVDMYDNCLRAKWFLEQEVNSEGLRVPLDYGFDDWEEIQVPGVWNLAKPEYFYYEGPAVYSRRFSFKESSKGHVFLRFGAVSYEARIFLNGKFLGVHKGGSTPFCVEVTEDLKEDNRLIVVADNTRRQDQIPSENTDWFLYGGIYRNVSLLCVPQTYIKDMKVSLADREKKEISVSVTLGDFEDFKEGEVVFSIPELKVVEVVPLGADGRGQLTLKVGELSLWSPENPKLYEVFLHLRSNNNTLDQVKDRVGFRTVETRGREIHLNGEPVFLRGVCLHEETEDNGKAVTKEDIRQAFDWAKKMNCNFLRLAHYPHTEWVSELADEAGLLLWEEIPVYWWIDFTNPRTLEDGKNQLTEMMNRDYNRASVIIWSVGNENPDTDKRYHFMKELAETAKEFDSSRLVSAACLVDAVNLRISDRLEKHLDVIGFNEYYGWYDPDYEKLADILEGSKPEKPVVISEFGGDGYLASGTEGGKVRGSKEEQKEIYKKQVEMFGKIDYIQGTAPWILFDYRTPKRLGKYQKGYNIKGLVTADRMREKPAFLIMKEYYEEVRKREQTD
ncbi:glycoside hydrolase family 2 protein [Lacrimispora sp.]|uniref:glycoside hydrolase family 2 protein n=1 Tax=Lacrimispora sp. TaxID=2719234 RepID=UPI002859EA32|nr:glycoside hydrolase family 2 TIM barrel-domain containing protein [Lacrimispora sp.]MDR7813824.1 glycoside hydrolase family 2 TIM barrel-domain containing protein [Lacrimispora sp.]